MWIYVQGVSLSVWPVPIVCLYRNVRWHVLQDCMQFHQCKLDYKYMYLCILPAMDECFLSLSLKRVSILCVCQKIWKLNFHLVYLLSFVMNFLLSNSFLLQNGSWMPIFVLSSNQWTGIIVSSSLAVGFWETRKIETLFKLKDKNIHPSHIIYIGTCTCNKFTLVKLHAILKSVSTNIPI